MSFKDGNFRQRFGAMGDEAEAVFEATYPRAWTRYGLNRPAIQLKDVPPFIRFTPDYLTSHGAVEVQGFGNDQLAKFKVVKLDALVEWDEIFPVTFFLYDKTNQRYGYSPLYSILSTIQEGNGDLRTFPEGTPYWALPAEGLGIEQWAVHTSQ